METKLCSKCGKKMVKWRENRVLLSDPPQFPWSWRCGCGYEERGGIDRGLTEEETFRRAWQEAQE